MPDQTVLITGATSGIGEAFAHHLAAEGHGLILVARREGELQRVKGVIGGRNATKVETIAMDLGEPGAGERLAATGIAPDVVINCAGFGLIGEAVLLPVNEQLASIDLNVRALTDISLRFLPRMVARRAGGLINVASTAAFGPGPNMAVYFASKAYVLSLTEALAEEAKGSGVTITALCPGPVATGFQARSGMGAMKKIPGNHLTPSDVVAQGWAGFKAGQRVVIPGNFNKLVAYGNRFSPHRLGLPITRFVMGRAKGTQ